MSVGRYVQRWIGGRHWSGWVVSGVGLALAGLSLWYLIVVKAFYLGTTTSGGVAPLVLQAIEVTLLASFSLVLIYGGYWLAAAQFDAKRTWWAGLWTMLGLAGVVAIVTLVTAFRIAQGQEIREPTLIQETLLAAGGGALAGLLIGISTVRETVQAEQAREQRDTLLFLNELLRHNVLNGMNVIIGNTELLEEHVDEEGQQYLTENTERARSIVELVQNVRSLVRSVSGETTLGPVTVRSVLQREVERVADTHPDASIDLAVVSDVVVTADELLEVVFRNLLENAIEHNDGTDPNVEVTLVETTETVRVRIADDGPGIPDAYKETYFGPGEQDDKSAGQGLGLYLVDTLVRRYGGDVWIEDRKPRGSVVVVELVRPEKRITLR